MGTHELLPEQVATALAAGRTVVTSNQRAARMLHIGFDAERRAAGERRWRPADVLTLEDWAAGLWHRMLLNGAASRMLLNRSQEHAVWRGIVSADTELVALRSVDALAELASEAWSLLCRFHGIGRLREVGVSPDTAAFQRWAMAFERRCRKDALLSRAAIWQELEVAVERGELPVAEQGLLLVGFDRMDPAPERLLEALRRAGFAVDRIKSGTANAVGRLCEAKDERAEVRAAARWAQRQLELTQTARLALIVPGLDARRSEMERIFREVLAPELEDISANADRAPYEFSLGRPLAEAGQVAAALALLRWCMEPMPLEEVSSLLRSPYLVPGSEVAIAEFDALDLRQTKMLRTEIALDWTIEKLEHAHGLGELAHRLRQMRRTAVEEQVAAGRQRPHAEWAEAFRRILRAAGWPGGARVDSRTFQMLKRWESTLDELATLDFDGSRASAVDALSLLSRMTREAIFAPESHDAPVQIMGPLEAAGQTFDGLWFMGASDLDWPSPVSTTALLPWQIQRELGMPGADTTHDLEIARSITRRLASSAQEVIFSYAVEIADGKQKVSPLIAELELDRAEADDPPSRAVLPLEAVAEDARLPALPDRVHRGGASVLQAQAACGFKAFAEHRLWSSELESREPGMDPAERGGLVHKTMQGFWAAVKDQKTLKGMPLAERERILDECIEAAWADAARDFELDAAWEIAYGVAQRERLRRLLRPWLEIELARPEFAVHALELTLDAVAVGPLRLKVRVDRIDHTAGGLLIVDYKTGPASPGEWLSERPDAPQLPLYAVVSGTERIAGVAFALLRPGEDLDLRGMARDETVLAKIAKFDREIESFDDQVTAWRRVLNRIAEDFSAGELQVNPKRYPQTCQYCAQRLLCRLDPGSLEDTTEDDEVELG